MNILVLAGGGSNEREVSLDSGAAISAALKRLGHEVCALDPTTGQSLLTSDGRFVLEADSEPKKVLSKAPVHCGTLATALATDYADIELVFIGLHGGGGENGSIQNLLDLAGKPYTGSGMAASAVAMDKALAKRLMTSVEVATPKWRKLRLAGEEEIADRAGEVVNDFELPIIVKPNDGGSTIGLTKVENKSQIAAALRLAFEHSRDILIEDYVAGRELTVSVIDSRPYPLVEIKPRGGLYDYIAKYTKGGSEYVAPAEVTELLAARMQEAAVTVYEAIGCSGLARVDFILDENDRFYCLEINTLPGMTELSLAPMAVACENLSFDNLVEMIIASALRK